MMSIKNEPRVISVLSVLFNLFFFCVKLSPSSLTIFLRFFLSTNLKIKFVFNVVLKGISLFTLSERKLLFQQTVQVQGQSLDTISFIIMRKLFNLQTDLRLKLSLEPKLIFFSGKYLSMVWYFTKVVFYLKSKFKRGHKCRNPSAFTVFVVYNQNKNETEYHSSCVSPEKHTFNSDPITYRYINELYMLIVTPWYLLTLLHDTKHNTHTQQKYTTTPTVFKYVLVTCSPSMFITFKYVLNINN
jgi:hypothetical protein